MSKKHFPGYTTFFLLSIAPFIALAFAVLLSRYDDRLKFFVILYGFFLLIPLQWVLSTYVNQEDKTVYLRTMGKKALKNLFKRDLTQYTDLLEVVDHGSRSMTDWFGMGKKRSRYTVTTHDGPINLPAFRKTDAQNFADELGIPFVKKDD